MAGRFKMHRSAARARGGHSPSDRLLYSGEGSHEASEIRSTDLHSAAVAHHVFVGLVAGRPGHGRLDKVARVPGHDHPVAQLKPHDTNSNRPVSEVLSRQSTGNLAARKGGKEEWARYGSKGSETREKRSAALSGQGARGRHCTGYLAKQ